MDLGDPIALAANPETSPFQDVFEPRLCAVGIERLPPNPALERDQIRAVDQTGVDERSFGSIHSIGRRIAAGGGLLQDGDDRVGTVEAERAIEQCGGDMRTLGRHPLASE